MVTTSPAKLKLYELPLHLIIIYISFNYRSNYTLLIHLMALLTFLTTVRQERKIHFGTLLRQAEEVHVKSTFLHRQFCFFA